MAIFFSALVMLCLAPVLHIRLSHTPDLTRIIFKWAVSDLHRPLSLSRYHSHLVREADPKHTLT